MTGKTDMKKILMTMGMINAMLGSEFMDPLIVKVVVSKS